jgi:hypothetical protein
MHWPTSLLAFAFGALSVRGASVDAGPGYKASKVQTTKSGLTADLLLAGKACNVYGEDVEKLKLEVTYETRASSLLLRARRSNPTRQKVASMSRSRTPLTTVMRFRPLPSRRITHLH